MFLLCRILQRALMRDHPALRIVHLQSILDSFRCALAVRILALVVRDVVSRRYGSNLREVWIGRTLDHVVFLLDGLCRAIRQR